MYKLRDDLAIVQTVDYFTPIVDDPYSFGQIAAANALSDIYAMGGNPITAMNIVCFPSKSMDIAVLREILRGGMDKLREAEVALVGGHSVDDPELKYGLSVTGVVHPEKVLRNTGARNGDWLILTKPIGTGIINTAIKANMADKDIIEAVIDQMATLNKAAAGIMQEFEVHGCTDVTGFGLLGHACEMVQGGPVGFEIDHTAVPVFPRTLEYAGMGLIPAGAYRNRDFRSCMVEFSADAPLWASDILFDPQTSGGLLITVPQDRAPAMVSSLHEAGCKAASIIGVARAELAGRILVR